ncbi:hypothetical protein RRG08_048810 [Elysia crispata]|uniref:C2H2-type domain-containing protein n=1 Tax=Elysia crispata TaxID=231223 RepID=A0AAE1EAX4_9GAST|nr:hypothetical protein RRG08_048810 [Elysia crispata]
MLRLQRMRRIKVNVGTGDYYCGVTVTEATFAAQEFKDHSAHGFQDSCSRRDRYAAPRPRFNSSLRCKPLSTSRRGSRQSDSETDRGIAVNLFGMEHNSNMTFHCDICGTPFTKKYNLTRHKGKCAGTKSYSCHLCQKHFFRSDKLRHHMITTHVTEYATGHISF